jgi:molybdenum cofactor biosynthesis enzyme MoaA
VVVPLQYEFCATCGLDLLSNPGALVTRLTTESVTVQCDCGAPAHDLPAWMWR